MERLKERFTLARKALRSLEELLIIESPSKVERDAAIQRFEYTFEAVWKAAGRFLLVIDGIDVASPKAIVRSSREVGLFKDDQAVLALAGCWKTPRLPFGKLRANGAGVENVDEFLFMLSPSKHENLFSAAC